MKKSAGTILVVDDEVVVQETCRAILEELEFAVRTANDGREALESFLEHQDRVVLILLDIQMPRLDGPSTLVEMRKLAPDVPILMMSGCSDALDNCRTSQQPPTGIIQKPFDLATLNRAVRNALAD